MISLLVVWLLLALVAALLIRVLLIIILRMLLALILMTAVLVPIAWMVSVVTLGKLLRHLRRSTLEVDVHPTCVCFCRVL